MKNYGIVAQKRMNVLCRWFEEQMALGHEKALGLCFHREGTVRLGISMYLFIRQPFIYYSTVSTARSGEKDDGEKEGEIKV